MRVYRFLLVLAVALFMSLPAWSFGNHDSTVHSAVRQPGARGVASRLRASPGGARVSPALRRAPRVGGRVALGARVRAIHEVGRPWSESRRPPVWRRDQTLSQLHAAMIVARDPEGAEREVETFTQGVEEHFQSRGFEHGVVSPEVDAQYRALAAQPNADASNVAERRAAYRSMMALRYANFRRNPGQIRARYVRARGTVDGHEIPEHELYIERWSPVSEPSDSQAEFLDRDESNGDVDAFIPGFRETGRYYDAAADEVTRRGGVAYTMDHGWAGQTLGGDSGSFGRGFEVTRDVAAFIEHVVNDVRSRPGPATRRIRIHAISMGGGPGLVGVLSMEAANRDAADRGEPARLVLHTPDGASHAFAFPSDIPVRPTAEGAYLAATRTPLNLALKLASHIPIVRGFKTPASRVPTLTYGAIDRANDSDAAALEGIGNKSRAFSAADRDVETIVATAIDHRDTIHPVAFLHANDPLASKNPIQSLAARLGERATFVSIPARGHVFQGSAKSRRLMSNAVDEAERRGF